MKYLLFTLIITNSCFSQTLETVKTYHDPYTKTQLHELYTVIKNTPTVNGLYKRYDENGTLIEEKTYKNNSLNGITKIYFNAFMAQLWDNPKDWYGKIAEIKNYKDNLLDGEFKEYHYHFGEKKLLKEVWFKDDQPVKIVKYFKDGTLEYINQLNGENKEYHENGKLLSISNKVNGEFDGAFKIFYDNDTIKIIGQYKLNNKIGKWKEFNNDGSIIYESNFDDEFTNTHKIEYYKNGSPKSIRDYIGDFTFSEISFDSITQNRIEVKNLKGDNNFNNLEKIGIDSTFYSSGKLKSIYNYTTIHGSLEKDSNFVEYYETGQLKKQGKYSFNRYVDTFISFFENGKIESIISYTNTPNRNRDPVEGNRNGIFIQNYENGNPKITGQYKENTIHGNWNYYKQNGELDYIEYGEDYQRRKKSREQIDDENNYHLIDSLNLKLNKLGDSFYRICKVETFMVENPERPMGPKIESYKPHEKKNIFNTYIEIYNHFLKSYKDLLKSNEKLVVKEKLYSCLLKLSKYLDSEDKDFEKQIKKIESIEDKIKLIER